MLFAMLSKPKSQKEDGARKKAEFLLFLQAVDEQVVHFKVQSMSNSDNASLLRQFAYLMEKSAFWLRRLPEPDRFSLFGAFEGALPLSLRFFQLVKELDSADPGEALFAQARAAELEEEANRLAGAYFKAVSASEKERICAEIEAKAAALSAVCAKAGRSSLLSEEASGALAGIKEAEAALSAAASGLESAPLALERLRAALSLH